MKTLLEVEFGPRSEYLKYKMDILEDMLGKYPLIEKTLKTQFMKAEREYLEQLKAEQQN